MSVMACFEYELHLLAVIRNALQLGEHALKSLFRALLRWYLSAALEVQSLQDPTIIFERCKAANCNVQVTVQTQQREEPTSFCQTKNAKVRERDAPGQVQILQQLAFRYCLQARVREIFCPTEVEEA